MGHIAERAITVVVIQTRHFRLIRQPHVERGDVSQRVRVIAQHQQIEPAIVVVVEERHPKTVHRLGHASRLGYVRKPLQSVIPVQRIGRALARHIQVRTPVVIEVAPRHAFHITHIRQS